MRNATCFQVLNKGSLFEDCDIVFDTAPPKALMDTVIARVGENARDSMKVEVAFADLLREAGLHNNYWWQTEQSSSTRDLVSVPLGPMGANDIQNMQLGTGLAHHGLIVGRPGSGKTNLMHVLITGLALKYSPEELELYLIDFKKGVGFKAYADYSLPHARVIAIESEREFGISVLRSLDEQLTIRGEKFRKAKGAEKLSEYRERTEDPMTRIVLIADEFQEFFSMDDGLSREAALLFDRIVRQGRAFGIHVVLGTQTLGGSYGLGRSTADQISVRVALQCSDSDSRLILGDDNPGARFLSRPGEAIYNAENGAVQANKLFQVAIFTDKDKEEFLREIQQAAPGNHRKPIVFEGHEPAHLENSEAAARLMRDERVPLKLGVNAWLGEPIAIKAPTQAHFRRQAGANLLIVTREEEQGTGLLAATVTTLAAQHFEDDARFVLADYSTAGTAWESFFAEFSATLPHESQVVGRRQLPSAIQEISREVEARHARESAPLSNIFLVVCGLQRARDLRKDDDDYSNDAPADLMLKILRDGPEVGVHTLVWVDTAPGVARVLGRKALAEFGFRVAGVMSPEDSQTLLDEGAAAKIDRPHRMLFFDEERPGILEKFRPFSLPTMDLLRKVATTARG